MSQVDAFDVSLPPEEVQVPEHEVAKASMSITQLSPGIGLAASARAGSNVKVRDAAPTRLTDEHGGRSGGVVGRRGWGV